MPPVDGAGWPGDAGGGERQPFAGPLAEVQQEFREQFVVVQVRFPVLVIQRPGAGVVVGHLSARLGVARFEQLQAGRVVRDRRVVVDAHQCLDEAVQDPVARRVRVLGVHRARAGRDEHTPRGPRLEDAESLLGGGQVFGGAEALVAA